LKQLDVDDVGSFATRFQKSGDMCYFLRDHRGHPIPSPAFVPATPNRFVGAINTYATTQNVPLIALERDQRKDDVVADYRTRRPIADGVVVIGPRTAFSSAADVEGVT
jgi:hypothetical protein